MSMVRIHQFNVSLDGFGTGEGQSFDAPFGTGIGLVRWQTETRTFHQMMGEPGGRLGIDDAFAAEYFRGIGAEIMGRGKFIPRSGPWTDEEWKGWWGDNPPFHTPVYVLTHHPRPSLEMAGGTTFHFVDATPREALELARAAAGDLDVRIGGGPTVVRDFLAAGLVDYAHFAIVPLVLGRGVRVWDGLEALEENYDMETSSSPSGVVHLTMRRRE